MAGPKGLREKMNQSVSFMGYWMKSMIILEIPQDLHTPPEKSDYAIKDSMPFIEKYNRVAIKDDLLTVFPLRATNKDGDEVYSYIGIPNNAPPKFIPSIARELGCDPQMHFRMLIEGKTVYLDNGDIVQPEMVCEP